MHVLHFFLLYHIFPSSPHHLNTELGFTSVGLHLAYRPLAKELAALNPMAGPVPDTINQRHPAVGLFRHPGAPRTCPKYIYTYTHIYIPLPLTTQ